MRMAVEIGYIFILFINVFSNAFPVLTYADELTAALLVFIAVYKIIRNPAVILKLNRQELTLPLAFAAFMLVGVCGTLIYGVQPSTVAIVKDIISISKMFMAFICCPIVFEYTDRRSILKRLVTVSKGVSWAIAVGAVVTVLSKYGNLDNGELRHGVRVFQFFFPHPTMLVLSLVVICCVFIADSMRKNWFYISICVLSMIATMRDKVFLSVIAVACAFAVYFVYQRFGKKSIKYMIGVAAVGSAAAIAVSGKKIMEYIEYGMNAARPAMYAVGLDVAVDYFPFGSGFASFGSWLSGEYYSPLYSQYGISSVYGISPDNYTYIADVYWPQIYAQYSFIGLIIYGFMLYLIGRSLFERYRENRNALFALLTIGLYMLVSSVVEAVFTNDSAMIFAILTSLLIGGQTAKKTRIYLPDNKCFGFGDIPRLYKEQVFSGKAKREAAREKYERSVQKPQRILFVNGLEAGGIECFSINLLRKISKDKLIIDFACGDDPDIEQFYEAEAKGFGSRMYKLGYSLETSFIKRTLARRRAISAIVRKNGYEIVHLNTLSNAWMIDAAAARLGGAQRIIAHSHTSNFVKNSASGGHNIPLGLKYILHKALTPFSSSFATECFACSESAAIWMFGDRAVEEGRVKIIPNVFDTTAFTFDMETRNRIRAELGVGYKTVIGNIANFIPAKNHGFMLEIFSEVKKLAPESVLILIGDGDLREEITQTIKKLGLEKDVILLGRRKNVADYLCAMDVFLMPSKVEGLPIAVLESQASGLPTVNSTAIANEAQLSEYVYRVSLDNDAKAWAEAVVRASLLKPDRVAAGQVVRASSYNSSCATEMEDGYLCMLNKI